MKPRFVSCFAREVTARRTILRSMVEGGKGDAGQISFDMNFRGATMNDNTGSLLSHMVIVDAKFTMASPTLQDRSVLNIEAVFQCRFEIDRPLDDELARDLNFVRSMRAVAEPVVRRFTQQLLTSMDIGILLQPIPDATDGVVAAQQNPSEIGAQLI